MGSRRAELYSLLRLIGAEAAGRRGAYRVGPCWVGSRAELVSLRLAFPGFSVRDCKPVAPADGIALSLPSDGYPHCTSSAFEKSGI